MNMLDLDWARMGAIYMMGVVILLVPVMVLAGSKLDERFGHRWDAFILKVDAYLLKKLKKFDER